MLVIPIRKILEKPLSIAISIVLSGALPLGMTAILSIPRVNALLLAINETATMNARVRIYEILMSIITQKYWLGYGYNTLIVKERLYSNAQNGMLHIIVQFGMLGAATLVLLCYIATRNRYKRNKDVVEWCEFWLFALIVAGIIEITFGVFFYVFLALINCATNEYIMMASVYKDAGGIWHEDRFRPLLSGITNLGLNLLIVKFLGLYGIVLSTIVSMVIISAPWITSNIFKLIFKRSAKDYIVTRQILRYV